MPKKLKQAVIRVDEIPEIVSPLSEGILFKPLLHPTRQDGSALPLEKGAPEIRHSTAMIKVKAGFGWPPTIFHIAELYYITQGKGIIVIDHKEYAVKTGDFVYVAPGLERSIRNTGREDLIYLSITDPEWTPETEIVR